MKDDDNYSKMLFLKVISIAEQYCRETNIMERSSYCLDWGQKLDWE